MNDPKPKRRSAWRHAAGGLVLLGCIGLGMWLVERRGWTNFGGWWREQHLRSVGRQAIREQVQKGMTWAEVRQRIGSGTSVSYARGYHGAEESYWEYGFYVYYSGQSSDDESAWRVTRIDDHACYRPALNDGE
jgi:hypothetical protein